MSAFLQRAQKAPLAGFGLAKDMAGANAGRSEKPVSHLGKTVRIDGVLDSEGELYLHGSISGRINAETLILCPEVAFEGDIVAHDVQIGGRLNGRVFVVNVTLTATAHVTGRIFHHTIQVAKGAFVDRRMPWRPANYFESLEHLPENQP